MLQWASTASNSRRVTMTTQEVKDYIGEENWDDFQHWMYGQTYGINDDGSANWYEWDVKRYRNQLATKNRLRELFIDKIARKHNIL